MLDSVANFIKLTVSTGYDQSATSIVLHAGGSSLPAAPFNVVWWNSSDFPDPSNDPNVEIVRVTNVSGNTLTIVRAEEGTAASTKNTGGKTYLMMLGITAKMIADIGNNLHKPWNAPQLVSGTIDGINTVFTLPIAPQDPNSIQLTIARQPQLLGVDFSLSGTTVTYFVAPDGSLVGLGHYAQYQ